MPHYTISESVGSRVLPVHSFEDLHKHHPSSGRQPGRDYGTVEGSLEEIRTVQGHTFIKKDFILSSDATGPVEVPAPASGYAHFLNDAWNTVQIYDKPFGTPGAQREAQVLHMVRNSSGFHEGAKVDYGQPLGRMGDTGTPGSIHVHVEAELGQFKQYIQDIDKGVIRPGATPTAGVDHAGRSAGATSSTPSQREHDVDARALQSELSQLGYRGVHGRPLEHDGRFGPETQHAVEAFQRDHHLVVDGKVGQHTQHALGEALQVDSVRHLQGELDKLGYKDGHGRTLTMDGVLGANTRFAVEAFQRDHHLHVDGEPGPQTQGALDQARKAAAAPSALMLDDPRSPDNALYRQALAGVQKVDAQMGRTSDQHSIQLAASLVPVAKASGLTRIDTVAISEDGSRTFAVQNTQPTKTLAHLDTAAAVVTPMQKSSEAAHAVQLPHESRQPSDPNVAKPVQASQQAAAEPSMVA